jgi:hypothetical protein
MNSAKHFKTHGELDVLMHTCDPSTQEAEAGLQVQVQPRLHS